MYRVHATIFCHLPIGVIRRRTFAVCPSPGPSIGSNNVCTMYNICTCWYGSLYPLLIDTPTGFLLLSINVKNLVHQKTLYIFNSPASPFINLFIDLFTIHPPLLLLTTILGIPVSAIFIQNTPLFVLQNKAMTATLWDRIP